MHKQKPKALPPIEGVMTCHEKRLIWWDDAASTQGKKLAEMIHPEIISASTYGVLFRGFEPRGVDKLGREILEYQEWWITPKIQP